MKSPLYDKLKQMDGRLSFHMPGHKGAHEWNGLDVSMDVTEIDFTDDLYHAHGSIAEAQRLAALSARAGDTIFLTNGSTCGVQAMLAYSARPGDKVILPRASHLSAVSACALGGLEPIWVDAYADDGGAPFTLERDILKAIIDNPDAACVLLTRPDYFGRIIPLKKIVASAHAAGMKVLVDEAHGAHFNWMSLRGVYIGNGGAADEFASGISALDMGADICIQSAHKTLPALTGGALLNMRAGEDCERLLRCVALTQSTSPSFLIMASLDRARAYMDEQGARALNKLCEMCDALHAACADIPGLMPAREYFAVPCDRTRLAMDVCGRGITGFEALEALEKMGIDIEMADYRRIVMITSVADNQENFDRLLGALKRLPMRDSKFEWPKVNALPRGERIMGVREAALGQTERVPLEMAAGHAAARALGVYPPGVPLCVPGELISPEVVRALQTARECGANLFGMEKDMCVAVKK